MAESGTYIAVDLGAESGRVAIAEISNALTLTEAHRFSNGPIEQDGSLRWDLPAIVTEVKAGIRRALQRAPSPVRGIALDSWGVDFGLIDRSGKLLENPYHYRDSRTDTMMQRAFDLMPKRQIYRHTGIQFLQFNSIFQLLATRLSNPDLLDRADKLIFMADLVAYHLCRKPFAEYTLASTSQLMDMTTGTWSRPLFEKLALPMHLMPDILKPPAFAANLAPEVAAELAAGPIPVIAAGSHDTACAVAGVPVAQKDWAYISSGTWSLMGIETTHAVINDKTFACLFTNEGGVENTIRLLKNIMGLWLVQQCRSHWAAQGEHLSYAGLTQQAQQAEPFAGLIDPDYSEFLAPGHMPDKINRYLKMTGQQTIHDKPRMVRLILESLALKYRWALERLQEVTGRKINVLHLVGGGIKNELLCRFTADSTAREVIAGPVEATAAGNAIMQAKAAGQIESLSRGREIIRNSFNLRHYEPTNTKIWDEMYEKFVQYIPAPESNP